MRELRSDEDKGLLMQYHLINIEKLPKRIKKLSFKYAYLIGWSIGAVLKIIISLKSNAVESNHSYE